MDRYLHAFDAAEQARIQGNNEKAVLLYAEAASLAEYSSAADLVELHLRWGMTLLDLGADHAAEAWTHLIEAKQHRPHLLESVAIDRELGRACLIKQDLRAARRYIDLALESAPDEEPAERGACLGMKARYLIAGGYVTHALEDFGTASMLLQRSNNRYYELENGLEFAEALAEHSTLEQLESLNSYFDRVGWLATKYGGKSHRRRWQELVHRIREMKGLAVPTH